ncbi:Elongation of very long chain fatty acids protein 1 [Habropoda laboriosa]|uniref:Elongation of very long chain fatty acids protein n=1 Tax=Habropoda laboriosa TaxID=597456 RepID=A0A0L7QZM3_9HYME|nr:PREDICTED: elongation of very long chain fatty acids protein 1-like [Habropoda laboriosa]KOC64048.1 Elongation of very long chain fatty acids protein 1 [Habropoda laboriosa]
MGFVENYDYYWNQKADPRTNVLPFIGSPILIPLILFSYLYFVLKCGPDFMKNRKPYNLKTFTQFYNVFQVLVNIFIVYNAICAGWFTEISPFCEIPDYSYTPGPLRLAHTIWFATMVKLIDLIETGVFVLRKKNKQISFLHLYHHVSTILLAWLITKYIPVAMASFNLLVNCSVHVIMYTYYFLSTFGPNVQKAMLPYKRMITIIQMVQFVILILHNGQSLLPSCPVPKLPGLASIIVIMINFFLFYNFYKKNYKKPAQKMS